MQLRLPSVPVRWAIGIILFVLVFAWFTAPNPKSTADSSDPFVGRWLVNGVDPFGVEYSGSLSITAVADGYTLDWIITGALVSGSGRRDGNLLSAEWTRTVAQDTIVGNATYRIDTDGNIVGDVRVADLDDVGTEKGEPVGG